MRKPNSPPNDQKFDMHPLGRFVETFMSAASPGILSTTLLRARRKIPPIPALPASPAVSAAAGIAVLSSHNTLTGLQV
jgi:hypothetical protein